MVEGFNVLKIVSENKRKPDIVHFKNSTMYNYPPAGFRYIDPPMHGIVSQAAPVLVAGGMATAVGRLQKAAFPKSQNVVAPLLAGLGSYVLARGHFKKVADRLSDDTHNAMKKVGL